MANKDFIKTISIVLTVVLAVAGVTVIYWLYTIIIYQPTAPEKKNDTTKINTDLYSKIAAPKSYGTEVTPEEPGLGRDNPFTDYKAPPAAPASTSSTSTAATPSGTSTAPTQ